MQIQNGQVFFLLKKKSWEWGYFLQNGRTSCTAGTVSQTAPVIKSAPLSCDHVSGMCNCLSGWHGNTCDDDVNVCCVCQSILLCLPVYLPVHSHRLWHAQDCRYTEVLEAEDCAWLSGLLLASASIFTCAFSRPFTTVWS